MNGLRSALMTAALALATTAAHAGRSCENKPPKADAEKSDAEKTDADKADKDHP